MTRILVVDDDELFGQMLLEWLLKRNYDAARVESAEESLKLVSHGGCPYDIFLVDQRLGPGMDGADLIARLRSICPESEAVLFTALDDPDIGVPPGSARKCEIGMALESLRPNQVPVEHVLTVQDDILPTNWADVLYE